MNQRLDAIKMEIEWQKSAIKDAEKRISRLKSEIEEFENMKCSFCNQARSAHPVVLFLNVDEYSIERHFKDVYIRPFVEKVPTGEWTFRGGDEMQICKEFQNPSSSNLSTSPQ